MATLLYTSLCMMIIVTCIYGSPIKRSATDQQATDCYGTECYYDPDYFESDTTVNVNFPENLTDVVVNFIPDMMEQHNQQIQNLSAIMAQVLTVLSERLPVPPPPRDCQDVAEAKSFSESGVYTITPTYGINSIQVFCDFDTEGGGWTVFHKRFDGSLDFFLGWEQYEEGFGNPDGEYWMGLRNIHRLTSNHAWVLRIDMEAFDGDTAYAMYDSFRVGDASSNYQLHIGAYHGTADDSLSYHNGQAFTTKDRDNDVDSTRNCAQTYKGAWWYNSCYYSNLNALYLGATGNSATGNAWHGWKGYKSLKRTEM